MNARALYSLDIMPAKPKEPVPPSKSEELNYSFSELLDKFIDSNNYIYRSDYSSDFSTFKHSEEFFSWLSKLAAEDKLSLKFKFENNGDVSDVDFYLKMDSDQYEFAKNNYDIELEKYKKDLEEYNFKYLEAVRKNISLLEDRCLKLKQEESELFKKYNILT